MISAAGVELHAAIPDSTRFDLDSDDVAVRRHDGREVECGAVTERNQDREVGAGKRRQYGGFGGVPSLNCLHTSKLHSGSDEHTFVPFDR